MNEIEIQQNNINTDTMKHYEIDDQVMMTFDTIGNGGESDGEGDEMIFLDFIKNKSFEKMLEHDLTKADIDTLKEGAIPSALMNWQPSQPPSNFKASSQNLELLLGRALTIQESGVNTLINQSIQKDNILAIYSGQCNCSSCK